MSDVGSPSPRPPRVRKFDRPAPPHDWRWWVGGIGKTLIATGLLLFGFVAYQLWGTGIETARAQSALKNQFEELVTERQAQLDQPPSSAPTSDGENAVGDPDDSPNGTIGPGDGTTTTTDVDGSTTSPTAPVDEALVPVDQVIPAIERGDPLALLEIPAIGRSDIVVPGVTLNDLKDGPGHYPETPLPGQLGNASIAGHRTTYGAPFFNVDQLVPGDEIIVTMVTGDRFVYEVTGSEIVSASDYWVVTTRDSTIAELTLTSCHPKYTARERIVIHSLLNPAKSSKVGFPTAPYDLDSGDDEQFAGDDPVVTAGPVTTPATSDVAEAPGDQPSADEPPASDDPAPAAGSDDTGPGTEVGDAFTQGWFADRGAFPQIALWGTVLTLISLAAYAISRRYRHDSIGFLVGIAPFLFALYFFFQNVNRLLPPGL